MNKSDLSINTLTGEAVDRMIANAARLRVAVSKGEAGETIIDAGKIARGGIEAGLAIAEICLGGLGTVWPRADRRQSEMAVRALRSQRPTR